MEKQAVITGSTRGIGKAVAFMLARNGYDVWLSARNKDELEVIRNEILQARKVRVHIHQVDFADQESRRDYFSELQNALVRIDVLVNNVGAFLPDTIEEPTNLGVHMETNFHAPFEITQGLLPMFIRQGHGHIFNVCSIVCKSPRLDAATYTISKNALYSYSQLLQKSMQEYGIKVISVLPGSVYTSSWKGSGVDPKALVQPEDVAQAIQGALSLSPSALPSEIEIIPLNPGY